MGNISKRQQPNLRIYQLGKLSTYLSSVATSLQYLLMEFSYHNSYIMPELAVSRQTSCIMLHFLQIGFWNRVATRLKSSLQKIYGCHHELVDRYGVCICTMKTDLFNMSLFSFPLLSTPDLTSRKAESWFP